MGKCKFDIAWRGQCSKPVVEGREFCEEHYGVVCSHRDCHNQAVKSCPMASSLVCGAPICDDHIYCHYHS